MNHKKEMEKIEIVTWLFWFADFRLLKSFYEIEKKRLNRQKTENKQGNNNFIKNQLVSQN